MRFSSGWGNSVRIELDNFVLVWNPLLPISVLIGLAVFALLVLAVGLAAPRPGRIASGWVWRLLGAAGLLAALANPALLSEDREALTDIAVAIIDDSLSQGIGERRVQTAQALKAVQDAADALPNLELRVVHSGGPADDAAPGSAAPDDGTRLFSVLDRALADIPRERFAGAVMITDGQIHDAPTEGEAFANGAPVHALLTGEPEAGDRRITIVRAPSYGIVGDSVQITLRVDEPAATRARQARLTIRRDGGAEEQALLVPVGSDHTVELAVDRGGPGVYDISVDAGAQELTLANNRAVLVINGVRDRLRVLLVSGEPHPGERTWRNLLKADPSVDLVHFTILRPPEKQDGTPVRELSLIAFPYRELFEIKLNEFDLIIFDRYRRMGVLPSIYLRNIADYVRAGGALLEAAAPSGSPRSSLYRTALAEVLPGEPTGDVILEPYRADVTGHGRRHPVTATLPGLPVPGDDGPPDWGRWFRQIDALPRSGNVLMTGATERPLLILDRVGEGRVAQFLSDHIWLWARGFENGGPHNELLRRLAHWLMKEPELEEDKLSATAHGNRLDITRRSLEPVPTPVEVTFPSGRTETVALEDQGDGRSTGSLVADEAGLYQLSDGERTALAGVGTLNPIEMREVAATDLPVRPTVSATGGGVVWLATEPAPELRHLAAGRAMAGEAPASGQHWIGLQANQAYTVRGIRELPLLPGLVVILLAIGAAVLAWRREGR